MKDKKMEKASGYYYRVLSECQITDEFHSGGVVCLCDNCAKTYEEIKSNENTIYTLDHWEPLVTPFFYCDACTESFENSDYEGDK